MIFLRAERVKPESNLNKINHIFAKGILIWYPIPILRRVPLRMAKALGDITAEYRWFAIVYVIGLFFAMPIFVFLLSLLGT